MENGIEVNEEITKLLKELIDLTHATNSYLVALMEKIDNIKLGE
jgi:hypothetical protein